MLFKTKEKTIFTPSALNSQEFSSGHKHDRHMQPDPWPDKTSGKQNNNSPGNYKTKTYSEYCFQRPAFEQQYKQHPHKLSNLLLRDQFTVGKRYPACVITGLSGRPVFLPFNTTLPSYHTSLEELCCICRAFLTFCACSLILLACFASQ